MFIWKPDRIDEYSANSEKFRATVGQFHGSDWEWFLEVKQPDGTWTEYRSGETFGSSRDAQRACTHFYSELLKNSRK